MKAMPVYRDFNWGHYKVSVKPTGWRRFFYFIPYLNGTNMDLAITVRTSPNEKREFLYAWILYRFDGKKEHIESQGSESFVNNAQYKITEGLPLPYLSYPAAYNLQVSIYDKQEDKRSKNFVVTSFTLIDRDTMTIKILIGVAVAALATFIVLLVTNIIA